MRKTLTGAIAAGLLVLTAGPALAAPGDDGVDLAPLCSALSSDALAQFRASGLIPADALAKLPSWAQDDATLVAVGQEALNCGGDTVVTGAEANTVLCEQVLTVDYIEGVVESPQLELSAEVQAQILANVTADNVGQARDLFGCALPVDAPEEDSDPVDGTVPDTDAGVDTGGW